MRTVILILTAGLLIGVIGSEMSSGAVTTHRPGPAPHGYKVKVTVGGSLTVHWGFTHGEESPNGYGCNVWAKGGGLSKFRADSIRPARGYLLLRTQHGLMEWGLSVDGKARGTAERSITMHASGVNWGGDLGQNPCTGARPRRPESIDCNSRSLRTRAVLYATEGNFTPTLDQPDELGALGSRGNALIRVSMFSTREPFSSCAIPPYAQKPHFATTFILARSLRVSGADEHRLRFLRPGERIRLTDHYGGACTDGVPVRECAFVLDLNVTITRTG